ncbi:hypothetical protein XM38_037700 [Halomicronema hongdechloris C2206]|uniref:Uncharacterized protein n=1 Tax=Halomicronema hongdechloris C2206 TaxID=1641165 RepID=A0A1Z3HR76_9CYAN|nr:hypothetical protein XM38_037700 [Halomicronema hongdechloris C2206]
MAMLAAGLLKKRELRRSSPYHQGASTYHIILHVRRGAPPPNLFFVTFCELSQLLSGVNASGPARKRPRARVITSLAFKFLTQQLIGQLRISPPLSLLHDLSHKKALKFRLASPILLQLVRIVRQYLINDSP